MLDELDELVKKLLVKGVPIDTSEIDVVFDAPTSEWKSSLARPTVNCYLYHMIENHELRRTDWELGRVPPNAKQNGPPPKHTVMRHRMPYRIDASYMITAWANAIEDEHRLLWRVLASVIRYNTVPPEMLEGELIDQAWPLPIKVAQPESVFKNPADFWSGMEVHVKPAVNLTITLALDPERLLELPLVLTRRVRVHPAGSPESGYELPSVQFGGWLTYADESTPVSGAEVLIVERGISTYSDSEGRFKFDGVPRGQYTLRATSAERQVERKIEVPGEDYDLVLAGGPDERAISSDGGGASEPPGARQRGGSRRR